MLVLTFTNLSPVAFNIGFLEIRWYSLAYIVSAIIGFYYVKYLNKKFNIINASLSKKFFDDALFYIMLGVILGGRIGYTLFYGFSYYASNPLKIFYLWEGGMSFHGGTIGVIVSMIVLSKKYKVSFLSIADLVTSAIPIGLFLGRLSNFMNSELYGKPTMVSWGVNFRNVLLPRHPSQIYEALLEGLFLFFILLTMWFFKQGYYKGRIAGAFLLFYGCFRFFVEFYREGEIYFYNTISMGQVLSIPMIVLGIYFMRISKKNVA